MGQTCTIVGVPATAPIRHNTFLALHVFLLVLVCAGSTKKPGKTGRISRGLSGFLLPSGPLSHPPRQVFWLSDRLEIAAFPPRWSSKVTELSLRANPHPRLQRRDRHGISPCSGMPENDRMSFHTSPTRSEEKPPVKKYFTLCPADLASAGMADADLTPDYPVYENVFMVRCDRPGHGRYRYSRAVHSSDNPLPTVVSCPGARGRNPGTDHVSSAPLAWRPGPPGCPAAPGIQWRSQRKDERRDHFGFHPQG